MNIAEDSPMSPKPASPAPPRRVHTGEESAQLRHRPPANRFSSPQGMRRRRSSNFSEFSLGDARKAFQYSTDDLLLPKPSADGREASHDSSPWHSAPLAFALLPALGGMLFKNGSSVTTDVMLLGLAAIFLNWSVRLPWDWYHSAQTLRRNEEYNADNLSTDESEDDNPLSFSTQTLDGVPEDEPARPLTKPVRRLHGHEAATKALYRHEVFALLSCFMLPILGAYLLHTIRSQLTRSSEGLVSNYNLSIFLLAAELRPMAHLVKLVQARTLHLQRVVAANPYDKSHTAGDMTELVKRLEDLEARTSPAESAISSTELSLTGKQSTTLTTDVRKSLQPDLDALNRAVRRYEKRQTLQAFQTESRLQDLESRLNDAISLAAAVSKNANQRGFMVTMVEVGVKVAVMPILAVGNLIKLPFNAIASLTNRREVQIINQKEDRGRRSNGKLPSHGRIGDRLQSRGVKR